MLTQASLTGLDFEWSVEAYGNLLAIGGGKERMSHYFTVSLLVQSGGRRLSRPLKIPKSLRHAGT